MLNIAALVGRLVDNPELKSTTNGKSVCSITIAVDRSYVKPGEERQADFIDAVAWNGTAEFISKYFRKGSMIAVDGSIQTRNYEDKDGKKRKAIEVIINNAHFCGAKEKDNPITIEKPVETTTPPISFDSDYEEDLPF